MKIIRCTIEHLQVAAELFNSYRMFYKQESDISGCRSFLEDNIKNSRSEIYLLLDSTGSPVAFAQLYPTYCSLSMRPFYYLSDLYVPVTSRKNGYAKYIMNYLTETFTARGSQRITLDTAKNNSIAQSLYESLGYEKENTYFTYHRILSVPPSLDSSSSTA